MYTHPKWKYHATEQAVVVDDDDSEQALGDGWFDTPAEAKEAAEQSTKLPADGDEITEEERLELLEIAKSLGLNPHHKLGAAKLLALIEEARQKATE